MEKIAKAARHEKAVARGKERTGAKANKVGADARYGFEGGALMLEDELEVSALRDYQKRQADLQETIELLTKGLDTLNQQRRGVARCIPSAELPEKERFPQLNSLSERTGIEEDSLVVRRKARRTLHFLPYIAPRASAVWQLLLKSGRSGVLNLRSSSIFQAEGVTSFYSRQKSGFHPGRLTAFEHRKR